MNRRNASFVNGHRVPTKQVWLAGQRVRLRTETRRKVVIRLETRDHEWAEVVEITALLGDPVVILSRELAGSCVWDQKHLARVPTKTPKHENLPLKYRKSLLPKAKRHLKLEGESYSNLDFGFTAEQAVLLDELEAALKDNEHPCVGGDRRRECRARVVAAHQAVVKAGLVDALTPTERDQCLKEFLGNTAL